MYCDISELSVDMKTTNTIVETNYMICLMASLIIATEHSSRDGMIQGTGVSMHDAKRITIPRYIAA